MADRLSYKKYKELVAKQGQELLDVMAMASIGNMDAIEIEIPEGIDVFTDLAIGLTYLVDDLQALLAEREEREQELERRVAERTQALEEALAEVQAVQRRYVQREWETYLPEEEAELDPDTEKLLPVLETAVSQQQVITETNGNSSLAIPVHYADELIGVLGFSTDEAASWNNEDLFAVEAIAEQVGLALENQRLFDQTQSALAETERQAMRLSQLNEMGAALNTAADLDEIFKIAGEYAHKLLGGVRASMTFLEDDGQHLEVMALSGEKGIIPTGMRLPVQKTAVGLTVRENRLICQPQDAAMSDFSDSQKLYEQGVRSTIAAPLLAGGKPIGTLNVGSQQENAFQASDVSLMRQISTLLATSIESRNLFQQIQDRAAQLTKLAEIETALSQAQNEDDILTALSQASPHVEMVTLMELTQDAAGNPDSTRVLRQWYKGKIRENAPLYNVELTLADMPVTNNWIHRPDQVFLVEDVNELDDIDESSLRAAKQLRIIGSATLPLRTGRQWHGLVVYSWKEPHQFTEEEIFLFKQLQDATAAVFARYRAQQAQQRALQETELLYAASAALNAAQTYESVLQVLADNTLLGDDSFMISLTMFDRPWTEMQEPEWIEVFARIGTLPDAPLPTRYSLEEFPAARQLLSPDQPSAFSNIAADPRADETVRALYLDLFGARSTLFAPLVVGGQWVGYVNAFYKEERPFPEDELRRLTALMGQASTTTQSIRLLQAAQARARREQLLREITTRVRSSADVDTIMRTAVQEVGRTLGRKTFIYLGEDRGA